VEITGSSPVEIDLNFFIFFPDATLHFRDFKILVKFSVLAAGGCGGRLIFDDFYF
jgi:hypothetical protein